VDTLPATTAADPSPPPGWGPVGRTAFRFAFVYWLLYSFTIVTGFPLGLFYTLLNRTVTFNPVDPPGWVTAVGKLSAPLGWANQGLDWYTRWSCRTFLGVETSPPTDFTGAGDRLYAYCNCFAYLTLAVGVTVVWTVASELWMRLRTRRRPSYDRLNALFRLVLRLHLMYQLILYGAMKIWCNQFPPITDFQLETKYGDSTPMGLLWRFMQSSQPYTSVTGVIETACGLLLISRRTTLLGALAASGAMGQVFLLNMCYDVPVKLMSGHLVLMALTLVVQDWRKLSRFFLLAKPVEAAPLPAVFVKWRWCHRVGLAVRTLMFLAFACFTLDQFYTEAKRTGILSTPRPYLGRWATLEFERDGEKVPVPEQPANPPPAPYTPSKWAGEPGMPPVLRASIQPQFAAFVFPDQTGVNYMHTGDSDAELALAKFGEPQPIARLRVTFPEPERMVLEGPFGRQQVRITLRRIADPAKKEYKLRSMGFRWIQERPENG
jgi:uncharacterized membrane protein YphA (DoxX/SURF4 family)